MNRAAVVSSSSSSSLSSSSFFVCCAKPREERDVPQKPRMRTFYVQIEDIRADKLDNSIRLGDTLFDDDDATKQLDECVFKEPLASEFDAPSTVD